MGGGDGGDGGLGGGLGGLGGGRGGPGGGEHAPGLHSASSRDKKDDRHDGIGRGTGGGEGGARRWNVSRTEEGKSRSAHIISLAPPRQVATTSCIPNTWWAVHTHP